MMRRMDEFRKFLWKKSGVEYNTTTTSVHPAVVASPIGMWSAVTPDDINGPAPSARSKHSATLLAGNVYLLGGRNGNVPLKDFWKYNLAEGKWYQIQQNGERPPCLQEHTAVPYRDSIYVFGGEVGFSAGTETPLWVYDVQRNTWRKVRSKKGVMVPRGRRGHTALVHRGTMLIYGGYQDLRGSSAELWAFHFETESWHLISSAADTSVPPARHKHSAIIHSESMWIYGGMTDLNDRSDLWRWDTVSRTWTSYSKQKHGPGSLHSHAACRLPGSMIIFGGETSGHASNDVWKFHFDTEQWEKLQVNGVKPQPRAECVALAISELLLTDSSSGATLESRMARTRSRTSSNSGMDKNARPSSYIPQNRVFPYEKTYVFKPSQENYTDGSHGDYAKQYSEQPGDKGTGFLREISKLSQLNLSRLGNNKCSYTVLTTGNNDSTESLLRQHSTIPDTDSESATPTRMIKSKSAYAIKKKYNADLKPDIQETNIDSATVINTRLNSEIGKMTREPISVPNFSTFTMPTPVLTPVEAARLVFLDSDDEKDDEDTNIDHHNKIIHVQATATSSPKKCVIYENFKTVKRGESYSSHLGYADNPLYQHMVSSASVKFEKCPEVVEILSDENISTSDYASIETMNRLSSSSSYSTTTTSRQQTPLEENTNAALFRAKNKIQNQIQDGPFGFCNPNYLGPDIQVLLSSGTKPGLKPPEVDCNKKQYAKLLNTPDSVLEDNLGRSTSRFMYCEENLELQNMVNTEMSKECVKHTAKHNMRKCQQPKSFEMDSMPVSVKPKTKCRASSASRIERHAMKRTNAAIERNEQIQHPSPDVFVPLYIFIIGGKEHGQVTVFKRPVSIWKLKLF